MKKLFIKVALAPLVLISFSAQALILDFTEVSNGFQGSTTITLSNATINSFGTDSFVYHPGDFGALGGGGFCGIDISTCEAGAEVLFAFAVENLTLNTQFHDIGDSAIVSIFDGLNNLLHSINVNSDAFLDFSAYTGIARLLIQDSSTGAGYAYTNFQFDAAAVPEPSVLFLLGAGLLGFGVARRRIAKS